jgi:hypothetical protein
MLVKRIICLVREVWRTIKHWHLVSGHNYVESQEYLPHNIQILKCKTCGHSSVAWTYLGSGLHPGSKRIN